MASNKSKRAWERRFVELKGFRSTHGNCNVPQGKALGVWARTQRKNYKLKQDGKKSPLTDEDIVRLDLLEFNWEQVQEENSRTNQALWMKRLEELKKYKKNNGDCLVPWNYPTNRALGFWVNRQRIRYNERDNQSALTMDRIAKLDALGFVWKLRETCKRNGLTTDELWDKRLEELKEYRREYGDCIVPRQYPQNKSLGAWVDNQRRNHRLKEKGEKSSLTSKRIDELDKIDFVWSIQGRREGLSLNELWNVRFVELKEFKKRNGNCNVRRGKGRERLGQWVNSQKKFYQRVLKGEKSPLTNERISLLDSIGFTLEVQTDLAKQEGISLRTLQEKRDVGLSLLGLGQNFK